MTDRKLIAAHTNDGVNYPGYINFSENADGTVSVIVRGDPKAYEDGRYICGYARDKGQPGRCTAGDENCNNYCNMAPEKGPMQPSPKPCVQIVEGAHACMTMSREAFEALKRELSPAP